MKQKLYCFIALILCGTSGYAQLSARYQLLEAKRLECERIISTASGKSETFDLLIKTGNEALKSASAKDHAYNLFFNQSVGVGYYYKQDFQNARKHFEIAHEEGIKGGLIEKSLKPLGNLVSVYHYLGMQPEADKAAQKLKYYAETIDTLKNRSDIYYNLGLYNQQQKFYYSIALENFLKSAELHKPIADTTTIPKLKLDYGIKLMMISEIYLHLEQPEKALQYLVIVKPILNTSVFLDVSAYGRFIRAYAQLNKPAEALKYYNLLHKAVGKDPKRWSELVSSNLEIARLYLKANNLTSAKSYLDKADKQAKLDNTPLLTSSVNLLFGDYYKKIRNLLEARKYYLMALPGTQVYDKAGYAEALKALTEMEMAAGNEQLASGYFKKYTTISDSLSQRKAALNLAEMEARYQNTLKQNEIKVLNVENNNKQLQLHDEKRTRWILAGAVLLALFAVAMVYRNYRTKQRANLLLDKKNHELDEINARLSVANQTRTKLFSIISHDLRSPVSQLFTFLKLQQSSPELISDRDKKVHQQKLITSSTELLETMEDLLFWSKSQMERFETEVVEIEAGTIFNEVMRVMQSQAEAKDIALEIEESGCTLHTDHNMLLIILRNLVQNALSHAYKNTVVVLACGKTTDQKVFLSVRNEGEAIPEEKIIEISNAVNVKSGGSGYGLLIVKELAEKLNASLEIESKDGLTDMRIVFHQQVP